MAGRLRTVLKRSALVGAAILAVFMGASLFVRWRHAGRVFSVADAPKTPVALVFGAGLAPGKSVSPVLAQRLNAAVALWQAGKVERIFLSGDNVDRYHDEPGAMRRYLEARGVPAAALASDPLGLSTYDTCHRAKNQFHLERVVLVTQTFHLPRALYIANGLGLDAIGVAADEKRRSYGLNDLRELVSRPVAMGLVLAQALPSTDARTSRR
jgi:vancomycin permeability regulator SanA